MKHILLTSMLICAFVFCKAEVNMEALKKDPDYLAYKKATSKLRASMASHYYVLPKNYAALQPELRKDKNPESMKRILKANGMIHADEFVNDIMIESKYMASFIKKHPKLMKLEAAERTRVFAQLLHG